MPSPVEFPPDHIFLYKPIPGVQYGGCRALVWLPKARSKSEDGEGGGSDMDTTAPLALMYHGGAFQTGSALDIPYAQVRYLLDRGVVVVSFSYRLLPHVDMKAIISDLLDSYKYVQSQTGLRADLVKAGAMIDVDPRRCAALGWSAGGSSVIYLAAAIEQGNKARTDDPPLPPLRCIAPTYPLVKLVFDEPLSKWNHALQSNPFLKQYWDQLMAEPCGTDHRLDASKMLLASEAIFGVDGRPPVPGILPAEDSRLAYVTQASTRDRPGRYIVRVDGNLGSIMCGTDAPYPDEMHPINLVTSTFPATCVVMADADQLVPPSQSQELFERLQALGVDSRLVVAKGMGHGPAEAHQTDPAWPEGND
ncbi:hypothetical protein FFLO_06262 [Filobasidium floriforme]|uniref:Alpha/beta hydrolase fold-3 domain-containing protein n=1 Tax=Filobasidium floriforme TaxID=5210 RepID=A0A8K0NKQ5_9TREE|nr:hypothetical protein FFLO_06262 [Filobasidium floriforme]